MGGRRTDGETVGERGIWRTLLEEVAGHAHPVW
jgi:hypothetical protein